MYAIVVLCMLAAIFFAFGPSPQPAPVRAATIPMHEDAGQGGRACRPG